MSIGLPSYLAPGTVSRSLVRAQHTVALVCLVSASLCALAFQLDRAGTLLWAAALALVPMIVTLVILDRSRTAPSALSYLVAGAVGVYAYTRFSAEGLADLDFAQSAVAALPMVALLLVGGAGGVISLASWCSAGFVVALGASAVALLHAGRSPEVDPIVLLAYFSLSVVLLLVWASGRGDDRVQRNLRRAVREETDYALRSTVEVRATALIHDTVLNHLAVVASSTPGPLSGAFRELVQRDIAILSSEGWLADQPEQTDRSGAAGWHASGLHRAVREARALGLDVEVTGATGAVGRLDPERDQALGLAVKQCLVNVVRHSGKSDAEVALQAAGGALIVMVIDAGRGFDESAISADRIGLKNSVRARIEAVQGSVQIWSTPGEGTSVVIRVPLGDPRGGVDA